MSKSIDCLNVPMSDGELVRLTHDAAAGVPYILGSNVIRLANEVIRLRKANRELIDLANTMSEAGPVMLNPFIDQEYADKIRELTDWKP